MIVADLSVLVPALLSSHEFHEACHEPAGLIDSAIGDALEIDAVLTGLPESSTASPVEASNMLRSTSSDVLVLPVRDTSPRPGRTDRPDVRHRDPALEIGGDTVSEIETASARLVPLDARTCLPGSSRRSWWTVAACGPELTVGGPSARGDGTWASLVRID